VSNHAAAGQESRHNLIYWHYGDYIGIGPGAHGRLTLGDGQKVATREHHAPEIWLDKVAETGKGAHPFQPLSGADRFMEALMMGLRLREGVSYAALESESGADWKTAFDLEHLKRVEDQGWLMRDDTGLRLPPEGMLRLNALIPYIIKG